MKRAMFAAVAGMLLAGCGANQVPAGVQVDQPSTMHTQQYGFFGGGCGPCGGGSVQSAVVPETCAVPALVPCGIPVNTPVLTATAVPTGVPVTRLVPVTTIAPAAALIPTVANIPSVLNVPTVAPVPVTRPVVYSQFCSGPIPTAVGPACAPPIAAGCGPCGI